jgi:hypothetical protein
MGEGVKVGVSNEVQDDILKKKYRITRMIRRGSANDSNDSHDSNYS